MSGWGFEAAQNRDFPLPYSITAGVAFMSEIFRRHSFSISLVALLLGFVFLAGEDNDSRYSLEGLAMGTSYQVQLLELPSGISEDEFAAQIGALLKRLDREVFSTYAPDSELSRLNRQRRGKPSIVSADLIFVLEMAREISESSAGAFDPTIGPLVNLWGFGPDINLLEATIPPQDEIDAAMSLIGYQHLMINSSNSEVIKTRDITLDLSAIAKGYAVDEVAALLDSVGITSYFIEVGGELKIRGVKADGSSWVPAIEAPVDTESRVYEIFYNRGESIAVAGSGDYRNYFEEDGVRYSHEIDPRTGFPIRHNLAAAYVIDESAAVADALATAYMILGAEEAHAWAQRSGQAAYLIIKAGAGFEEIVTPAFEKYLNDNP
ncbi:MAG: FAD:protein FMN transferase ApbE [Gammaproteobacteria bacterium]|nr:FAD:protein FMN transferase ApbE [Gammaproteobacteria bacterium]